MFHSRRARLLELAIAGALVGGLAVAALRAVALAVVG